MDRRKKLIKQLLFLSFLIYPLGQLPKLFSSIYFPEVTFMQPLDILVFTSTLFIFFDFDFKFRRFKYIYGLIFVFTFSLLVSTNFSFVSFYYLFRFIFYLLFAIGIFKFLKKDKKYKSNLLNTLLKLSFAVAIIGIIQYFVFPDLRWMKFLGWDDHLFRLTSSFLDPAFTGIILVLGILVSIYIKKYWPLAILLPAIGLTYSRATYLSLIAGVLFFYLKKSDVKKIILFLFAFVLIILAVPKNLPGEGVNLKRTSSIVAKLENYQKSFEIIAKEPLFGVGFNNICEYKSVSANACFGLDNSILFIWATAGILGLFSYLYFSYSIFAEVENKYKKLLLASALAVLVHTQFTNTLFYAWIMYWFAMLFGVTLKSKSKLD